MYISLGVFFQNKTTTTLRDSSLHCHSFIINPEDNYIDHLLEQRGYFAPQIPIYIQSHTFHLNIFLRLGVE
jgi:hypothetical protein